MTDKLKPALSAEDWQRATIEPGRRACMAFRPMDVPRGDPDDPEPVYYIAAVQAPVVIALGNAALANDDPRKITREKIALLRVIVSQWDGCGPDPLAQQARLKDDTGTVPEPPLDYLGDRFDPGPFLDALETYLPPE